MLATRLLVAAAVASSLLASPRALASGRYGFAPAPGRPLRPAAARSEGPAGSQSADPRTGEAPRHFAGSTDSQCGVVTYCGGPVISSVQVQPVFWTAQVNQNLQAWAEGYFQAITASTLLDMLSEYSTVGKTGDTCPLVTDAGIQFQGPSTPSSTGQTITRGSVLPPVTITPLTTTAQSIDDSNAPIGAELAAQIAAGKLPAPTYDAQGYPNTLYFVFFPSSYAIQLDGLGSCSDFGGYHQSATYTGEPSCKGQYIPYAVIPDCGDGEEGLESVCSHELAEAITDTDVGPTTPATSNWIDGAWYLGPSVPCPDIRTCPSDCGEVGDVCEQQGATTLPGTSVYSQLIWSQAQDTCAVQNASVPAQPAPGGPPVESCPAPVGPGGPGADAGTPVADAGAPSHDAGAPVPVGGGADAGQGQGGALDAGRSPSRDAGGGGPVSGGADASVRGLGSTGSNEAPSTASSGCGCESAGSRGAGGLGAVAALLGLAAVTRGRASRRSARR